jgi:hypothetical protein
MGMRTNFDLSVSVLHDETNSDTETLERHGRLSHIITDLLGRLHERKAKHRGSNKSPQMRKTTTIARLRMTDEKRRVDEEKDAPSRAGRL